MSRESLKIWTGLGMMVYLLATVWMIVAMVVAVRQALDYRTTYRAIGLCLIGWVMQVVIIGARLAMVGGFPEPRPAH